MACAGRVARHAGAAAGAGAAACPCGATARGGGAALGACGGRWRGCRCRCRCAPAANLAGGPGPCAYRAGRARFLRHAACASGVVAGATCRACRSATGLCQHAAGRLCRAAPGVGGRLVCVGLAADGAGGRCARWCSRGGGTPVPCWRWSWPRGRVPPPAWCTGASNCTRAMTRGCRCWRCRPAATGVMRKRPSSAAMHGAIATPPVAPTQAVRLASSRFAMRCGWSRCLR